MSSLDELCFAANLIINLNFVMLQSQQIFLSIIIIDITASVIQATNRNMFCSSPNCMPFLRWNARLIIAINLKKRFILFFVA